MLTGIIDCKEMSLDMEGFSTFQVCHARVLFGFRRLQRTSNETVPHTQEGTRNLTCCSRESIWFG